MMWMIQRIVSLKGAIAVISFSLVVYLFLALYSSKQVLTGLISMFSIHQYAYMLFFLLLAMFIKYVRWCYLLGQMNLRPMSKESFITFFSGFSMSVTPGKAGDFLKSFLMKSMNAGKHREIMPIVLMERITDVIALSAIVVVFSIINHSNMHGMIVLLLITLAGAMFLRSQRFMQLLELFVDKFFQRFLKSRRIRKKDVESIKGNMQRLLSFRIIFAASFIDVVSWIAESMVLYMIVTTLHPSFTFIQAVLIYSLSILAGALTLLPGGIGASEASIGALLIMFGINSKEALAMTILCRFMTLWVSTAIGIAFLMVAYKRVGRS